VCYKQVNMPGRFGVLGPFHAKTGIPPAICSLGFLFHSFSPF
jgi:hypothetical protein